MSKVWWLAIAAVLAVGGLLYAMGVLGWVGGEPRIPALLAAEDEPVRARFVFPPAADGQLVTNMRHLKVELQQRDDWEFPTEFSIFPEDGQELLLTLETWGTNQFNTYDSNPLVDIAHGDYDGSIRQLCRQLPRQGKGIYLRLNPDMEVPVSRYPWQQFPSIYLEAFRRFADLCHSAAPAVKVVWAPAGYPGAMEFYPGSAYIDVASVTARSASETTLDAYPVYDDLSYDIFRRLHRLRLLQVPILVLGDGIAVGDSIDQAVLHDVNEHMVRGRVRAYGERNTVSPSEKVELPRRTEAIIMGLYDPSERLLGTPEVSVEHLFADFRSLQDGIFQKQFDDVIGRGHDVIVTFEPFYLPDGSRDPDVLEHVIQGQYDGYIRDLFILLAGTKQRIYLRYAHEMEIPIERYPWQSEDPLTYIESYQYFMAADTVSDNIAHVWGPAGDRGSEEWYPGDDWVDYVSIAIYGLPDKDITDPTKQESFARIFSRKMWRMRMIDKPVFITEFGVKGPEDYQTDWMVKAAGVLNDDQRVVGINYFNMSDTPEAWGAIKPPDWSISQNTLDAFLALLQE